MARTHLAALLASLAGLAACGGSPRPAPSGSSDGEAQATCEPGRCLEDISRLISERKADTRACYDTARQRDATLAGKIIINFAIDSEGMVGEVSQGMQDDQLQDPALVACVSEVIKTVRFAKSPTGKTTRAYHRFEVGAN